MQKRASNSDGAIRRIVAEAKTWAAVLAALFLCAAGAGATQLGAIGEHLTPIYDPASKSYFQLYTDNRPNSTWDTAEHRAREKIFKGVRGRLAIIDSMATHKFVTENFDFRNAAWIGLRYWCPVRMLQWGVQRLYSPSDHSHFSMWHVQWSRYEEPCSGTRTQMLGYMPTYYLTMNGESRWQAVDAGKGFPDYLVQFPTGHE